MAVVYFVGNCLVLVWWHEHDTALIGFTPFMPFGGMPSMEPSHTWSDGAGYTMGDAIRANVHPPYEVSPVVPLKVDLEYPPYIYYLPRFVNGLDGEAFYAGNELSQRCSREGPKPPYLCQWVESRRMRDAQQETSQRCDDVLTIDDEAWSARNAAVKQVFHIRVTVVRTLVQPTRQVRGWHHVMTSCDASAEKSSTMVQTRVLPAYLWRMLGAVRVL